MNPLLDEYTSFIAWFKINHPSLYAKYARNIDIPFQYGGGVTVNNGWKISQREYERLYDVAHSYYHR